MDRGGVGMAAAGDVQAPWVSAEERVPVEVVRVGNRQVRVVGLLQPEGVEAYIELSKTHLLGAQIGGSNKDARNFVTMHPFANSPVMRKVEDQIWAAVDRGETIEYSVTPACCPKIQATLYRWGSP